MPTNKPNQSFQMNVHFKYKNDYKVMCAKCNLPINAVTDYTAGWAIKDAARGKKKLFTEFAADCNVIGFSNGKEAIVRHLIPSKKNLEMTDFTKTAPLKKRLLSRLQKEVDSLKADGKIKTVFIIAGQPVENTKTRSLSMLHGLIDFCKSNELEPTIVWGQRGGNSLDALFDVKQDTLTIQPYSYGQMTPHSIKDYFSWIKFNKEDKAILPNGRETSKNYLTQNKKEETSIKRTYHNLFG